MEKDTDYYLGFKDAVGGEIPQNMDSVSYLRGWNDGSLGQRKVEVDTDRSAAESLGEGK